MLNSRNPKRLEHIAEAKSPAVRAFSACRRGGSPAHSVRASSFVSWPASGPGRHLRQAFAKHLGRWLVENTPRGTNLEVPRQRGSQPQNPFINDHQNEVVSSCDTNVISEPTKENDRTQP